MRTSELEKENASLKEQLLNRAGLDNGNFLKRTIRRISAPGEAEAVVNSRPSPQNEPPRDAEIKMQIHAASPGQKRGNEGHFRDSFSLAPFSGGTSRNTGSNETDLLAGPLTDVKCID